MCLRPETPLWWWIGFGIGMVLLLIFIVQLAWLFINSVGIWGINIPVAWGFAIARIRVVDRVGERRDYRLGSVLFDSLAVALGNQSHRRINAAVGRSVRRVFADHAFGPPGFILLAVPLFECDGGVAAGTQPAVVGFYLPALLHPDVDHVLLRWIAAGPRDHARYGKGSVATDLLWGSGARLAWVGPPLAQAADRLRDHVGDYGADGDLGAQCRRSRLRRRAYPRLALDPVPALLLFRRGDIRRRADYDADHPGALGLRARRTLSPAII